MSAQGSGHTEAHPCPLYNIHRIEIWRIRSLVTQPNVAPTRLPDSFGEGGELAFQLQPVFFCFVGACHFVAKRREEETIAGAFPTSTALYTLEEEMAAASANVGHPKGKKDLPTSGV